MPELPEVETICQRLRAGYNHSPAILGKIIYNAEVQWKDSISTPSTDEFLRNIKNVSIIEIKRRGKYLIFKLSKNFLIIHLRMSGDLVIKERTEPLSKHDRLALNLQNNYRLVFNDVRKFGRVWLVSDPEKIIGGLGPEPLSKAFTPGVLYQGLQKHHRQIKPLLLDQSFLAGLGNIYTDEALYLAHIHPMMISNEINKQKSKELWSAIREILKKGIAHNGSSIDWVYRGGLFQNFFTVYHRAGEQCDVCGDIIKRIVVGQRGTHYCPTCQPMHRQIAE
jgi:formamidopyrimidine-DNA glycosylase